MTFHDEIEARYQHTVNKTNPNQWDADPKWYIAFALLCLVRGAAQDGVLKNRPTDFNPSQETK